MAQPDLLGPDSQASPRGPGHRAQEGPSTAILPNQTGSPHPLRVGGRKGQGSIPLPDPPWPGPLPSATLQSSPCCTQHPGWTSECIVIMSHLVWAPGWGRGHAGLGSAAWSDGPTIQPSGEPVVEREFEFPKPGVRAGDEQDRGACLGHRRGGGSEGRPANISTGGRVRARGRQGRRGGGGGGPGHGPGGLGQPQALGVLRSLGRRLSRKVTRGSLLVNRLLCRATRSRAGATLTICDGRGVGTRRVHGFGWVASLTAHLCPRPSPWRELRLTEERAPQAQRPWVSSASAPCSSVPAPGAWQLLPALQGGISVCWGRAGRGLAHTSWWLAFLRFQQVPRPGLPGRLLVAQARRQEHARATNQGLGWHATHGHMENWRRRAVPSLGSTPSTTPAARVAAQPGCLRADLASAPHTHSVAAGSLRPALASRLLKGMGDPLRSSWQVWASPQAPNCVGCLYQNPPPPASAAGLPGRAPVHTLSWEGSGPALRHVPVPSGPQFPLQ